MKSDGAVAWITATRYLPSEFAVVVVDKTGTRTLAGGSDVAPSSLAVASNTLYWTQGGKPMSAPLH